MDNRRMCPHCRAFITSSDKVCPYCGEKVPPRAIDIRDTGQMLMGFIPSARFVTAIILLINFALFLGSTQIAAGSAILEAGVETGAMVRRYHQFYRLITAGFLHANWLHILMNCWVLWDLGAQVEELYGAPRMTVIFFLATASGFLTCAFYNPMSPTLGASAGLFGLIGAMIALGMKTRNSMGQAIRAHYIRWAIYGLLFGLLPGISNAAHIGGLVAGFGVAYLAGTPLLTQDAPAEKFWRAASGVCVVLTLFSFFQLYQQLSANLQ
jgi:rhomboid protease GluP